MRRKKAELSVQWLCERTKEDDVRIKKAYEKLLEGEENESCDICKSKH